VLLVAQSGDKGASRPFFLTHGTSGSSPFGISKQFLRDCMKKGYRVVVRYSSRYEKALPNRSLRP
jgi:hypothetical protein